MAVISAFSYGEPVLGVSELARRLDLGKSTVHRILVTLRRDGFVERTPDERYRLSLKMYEIGQEVAASSELRERVAPQRWSGCATRAARRRTSPCSSGTDVVYLDRLESPHMLQLLTQVGRRRAAHATSSGKVLLAFGAAGRCRQRRSPAACRVSARGRSRPADALERALAEVRADGYAVSVEESAPGVASVAAPIFDRVGDCVAAISVAGPITRMPADQLDHFARLVAAATARLSTVPEAPVSLARRS